MTDGAPVGSVAAIRSGRVPTAMHGIPVMTCHDAFLA